MKNFNSFLLCNALLLLVFACEPKEETAIGNVEMYLVQSYESGTDGIMIDATNIQLQDKALMAYKDIIRYNAKDYTLLISDAAKSVLFEAEPSVYGQAFAVVANGDLVYTGFFWPGFYSMGCNWVVIDPLNLASGNEIVINLGYPGLLNRYSIPDNRNDERLLKIFRRDGKLIE